MDLLGYLPLELLGATVATSFAVALGVAIPALHARDGARAVRNAARVLLVGSTVAIFTVTLANGGSQTGVNLVPFKGIAGQLTNLNSAVGLLNIVGNAFMFVPAGFLAALALGWWVRRTTLAGLALSVAIEVTQLTVGRSADIDDVILNSAGAALAVVALAVVALAVVALAVVATIRGRRLPAGAAPDQSRR